MMDPVCFHCSKQTIHKIWPKHPTDIATLEGSCRQYEGAMHWLVDFNINIKSGKTKVKQCRRDFRKGNYREIRKNLAHIDWDEKMKNKTTTECWDILRGELDTAIDS